MPTIVTGGGNPQEPQNFNSQTTTSSETSSEQNTNAVNSSVESNPSVAQIATPQIVNTTVPVVVFVGPPASGKTMILVRLAKYLRKNGYTIETDRAFLNTTDYQNWCDEFEEKLTTNVALDGTVKFLLVKVYENSREVAKLLEAPGEDFFTTDPNKIADNQRVKPYLTAIMASDNPKSYVTLLDLDSKVSFRNNNHYREAYSDRFLKHFYPNIDNNRDRIVLLYNKIDVTKYGSIIGCSDITGARDDAKRHYPELFNTMKVSPFGGLISRDNFVFKTFCTGIFADEVDDNGEPYQTYNIANDIYPKELWKEIIRRW